jgi:hypothetical protein
MKSIHELHREELQMKAFKNVFLCVALFAGVHAYADLLCLQKNAGMDEGYRAIVTQNNQQATIQQISVAGAKTLSTLTCNDPSSDQPSCQKPDCFLICSEPMARDVGYLLYLHQNSGSGQVSMALSSVSYLGTTDLAFGPCQPVD